MMVMIATEDLVAGTLVASTVVIIAYSSTDAVVKVLSPFIIRNISFLASMIVSTVLLLTANVLIVVIDDVNVRILGAVFCGCANGYGVVMTLRMMAYYDRIEQNASAFQIGGNCSKLLASVFYTGECYL